jgi:cell division septal protein FtsQ
VSVSSTWHPSRGRAIEHAVAPARAARTRRASVVRWAWFGMGIVALTATVWWVAGSSIFHLRTSTITGAHHLSDGDVLRIAGLGASSNLIRLSIGEVERRLEANPWILEATVARSLPSTLSIRIVERRPVGTAAGQLVAADGMLLGAAHHQSGLPELQGEAGPSRGRLSPEFAPELGVAGAIPSAQAGRVVSISTGRGGQIVARLRGGVRVLFGDGTQAAAKWDAAAGVITWSLRNNVAAGYVDVRVPSFPSMGLRAAGGSASHAGTASAAQAAR